MWVYVWAGRRGENTVATSGGMRPGAGGSGGNGCRGRAWEWRAGRSASNKTGLGLLVTGGAETSDGAALKDVTSKN